LHPEEFIAKEVSIYELYLKETLASFQTLASSMEHIEEMFSFKVSYHTRILQNEVSEELAHVLKKHPDTASKPQSNS
jgi:Mg2+ and Co2+ transporter CorA